MSSSYAAATEMRGQKLFLEKVRATARKNQNPQNALERCVWECFIATFTLKFCHFWNQTAIMHRRHVKLGIVQPRDCPQFDLGSPRLKCWDMFSVFFHDGSMISSAATSFTQLYLCKGFNFVTGVRQGHEALTKMAKTQAEFTPKRNLSIYQPCIFRCELFRMCCGRGPAPWTTLLAAAGSFQEVVPWSGLPRTSRRSGRNGHLDWLAVLLHMKAFNLSMAGAFWPE